MNVLIAGCGYLGTAVGVRLSRRSTVYGLRRGASGAGLERFRIRPFSADLSVPATLEALPACDAVVFAQAPSGPSVNYRTTYVEGTRHLLTALKGRPFDTAQGKPRVIFVSSTSVYGTQDGSWVDEATPPGIERYSVPELSQKAAWLLEAEGLVLNSGFESMVLRLGGIYGPGRNHAARVREGAARPYLTDKYTNRIHVEDAAAAIEVLLDRGKPGEIYLGVDDRPSTQREFYEWLYVRLGRPLPAVSERSESNPPAKPFDSPADGGLAQGKRCSNNKLKALGWTPKYPSFKEGYAELL